ncbi:uncharacterized protein DSM5745_00925 [Aspergillus mulundensis]|uniref:Uncharacterized protein n=1 Tax=Aspergillus mulundensis TaxID=1810919 RepID=A0A3D8T4X0_9EURO|nr:Uncharacterized protein DSM5745_00925 [Aspergillus mulundensis]RDW93603.1 Uncharacterized protein DSM5745_00925 [Aspergillus mulundensis]
MQFSTLINLGLIATGALAYTNNCKGSSNSPSITDCQAALRNIDTSATYNDQSQFSVGNCYMIYATNDAGEQPVSGQVLYDTAKSILDTCGHHKGSYGTNNCDSCHVTVNYRVAKKL